MKLKSVIFDLDGTLLDTLADIAASMNEALSDAGLPTHELDAYRIFVGDGPVNLVRRTLPESHHSDEQIAVMSQKMLEIYQRRWREQTQPYDGIDDMLSGLKQRGISKAILSNKPHEFTVASANHFLSKYTFDRVYGAGGDIPRKPDPGGVFRILRELGWDARQTLYVGDTNTDMLTAKASELYAAGVSWGFRDREELIANGANVIVDHPLDILTLVDS